MIEAKKGILLIARMTGAPIVPVALYGTEKLLPINNDGDMKAETFTHAEVHINIGTQFELQKRGEEQDKQEYEDWAMQYMMMKIAELLPENYRGVYKQAARHNWYCMRFTSCNFPIIHILYS